MPEKQGKCPLCGKMMALPDNAEKCSCPHCGQTVFCLAALSYANATKGESPETEDAPEDHPGSDSDDTATEDPGTKASPESPDAEQHSSNLNDSATPTTTTEDVVREERQGDEETPSNETSENGIAAKQNAALEEKGEPQSNSVDSSKEDQPDSPKSEEHAEDQTTDPGQSESMQPLVSSWRTNKGLVAIGIAVLPVVYVLLSLVDTSQLDYDNLVSSTYAILYSMLIFAFISILYCLIVYPSYYKSGSITRNSNVASFTNGLFGGIIFGPLWCANLTCVHR